MCKEVLQANRIFTPTLCHPDVYYADVCGPDACPAHFRACACAGASHARARSPGLVHYGSEDKASSDGRSRSLSRAEDQALTDIAPRNGSLGGWVLARGAAPMRSPSPDRLQVYIMLYLLGCMYMLNVSAGIALTRPQAYKPY